MNKRLIVSIVLSFFSGIFGMDLALSEKTDHQGEKLRYILADGLNDFEVKIFDKNMFNSLTHYNAIFTITDNQYDVKYCYKGGGDKIPQEKRWESMPIDQSHLDEIATKSNVFYLCAFGKGEYEKEHDPACCIRIVQTIVNRNEKTSSVQLEDPDKKRATAVYNWNMPSMRMLVLCAFTPLIRSYQTGYLEQCRSILSAIWTRITG